MSQHLGQGLRPGAMDRNGLSHSNLRMATSRCPCRGQLPALRLAMILLRGSPAVCISALSGPDMDCSLAVLLHFVIVRHQCYPSSTCDESALIGW